MNVAEQHLRPARPEDRKQVGLLLQEGQLPTDAMTSNAADLWLLEEGGRAVAVGGFEFYGTDALLRSVAVARAERGAGFGSRIVDHLLGVAYRHGIKTVWLLTETARDFFIRKGFVVIERSTITNAELSASPEFTHVCSSTATCMKRDLQ